MGHVELGNFSCGNGCPNDLALNCGPLYAGFCKASQQRTICLLRVRTNHVRR